MLASISQTYARAMSFRPIRAEPRGPASQRPIRRRRLAHAARDRPTGALHLGGAHRRCRAARATQTGREVRQGTPWRDTTGAVLRPWVGPVDGKRCGAATQDDLRSRREVLRRLVSTGKRIAPAPKRLPPGAPNGSSPSATSCSLLQAVVGRGARVGAAGGSSGAGRNTVYTIRLRRPCPGALARRGWARSAKSRRNSANSASVSHIAPTR